VLHVTPEAMELGPLAAVRDGDMIRLDAPNGLLQLEISDQELQSRLEALRRDHKLPRDGGYLELYREHVLQADEGCDFDFLVGCRGAAVPAHSH
jgi:L-arabonate dehydrase